MTSEGEQNALAAGRDLLTNGKYFHDTGHYSFVPALGMLRLKGKPYSLSHHYMFEPMFRMFVPRRTVWKCARQVGKTQNLAASRLLKTNCISNYGILFVCPRFEQAKRLSNLNTKPLIIESPFQHIMVDENCEQSILQRTFTSGGIQYYSFAFLDCERIRGISCSEVDLDEVQDIVWEFIPVIAETMSGSIYHRIQTYTGTPKSFENTIQQLWHESSAAEWATRCGCGRWNIASLEHDLLKMIGKTTVICAKCGKPLNCKSGHWEHQVPNLRPKFEGYHISQVTTLCTTSTQITGLSSCTR